MRKQIHDTNPGSRYNYAAGLLLLTLLVQSLSGLAQVSVQLMPVSPVQLKLSDMWRAQLINTSGTEQSVYLKGSVSYSNSTLIVEGVSDPMVLKPGVTLLTPSAVGIKGYQFNSSVSVPNLSSTEVFPFGTYTLCLKVYSNASAELGANCVEATIKPLSPPMLLSPYNQSEIPVSLPLLIWSAPTPVPSGTSLQYELRLVEMLEGQTPTDAIQRNFALIEEKNLSNNFFQYPASATKLEKDKHYAWQITARGDNFLIGSTEVWSFTLSKDTMNVSKLYIPDQYYRLKAQPDGGYGVAIETLGITWEEEYQPGQVKIQVFDASHKEIQVKELKLSRAFGDNRFIINLKETGKFKNGQLYFIEIKGTKSSGVILFKYYSNRKKYEEENKTANPSK